MISGKDLAQRIEEVFLSGKVIAGTNYKQELEQVDFELATKKHGELNTIAELIALASRTLRASFYSDYKRHNFEIN